MSIRKEDRSISGLSKSRWEDKEKNHREMRDREERERREDAKMEDEEINQFRACSFQAGFAKGGNNPVSC